MWTQSMVVKGVGRRGFTLVEMLVVIGIIGLVAAMLLPSLMGARRAAATTKCLNNLRQIGMAMSQYMLDNEETIPFAVASNCWDDPGSPRGAAERPQQPWPAIALPVAYYLDNYLKYELRVWECPGTKVVRAEAPRLMRLSHVVRSDGIHTKDETGMWTSAGQWRPGYMFVSTHGWRSWYFQHERPTWDAYGMSEWKVRNVSGLRLSEIKTTTMQPSNEVVVFFDYSSTFHSKATDDVYMLKQPSANLSNISPSAIVRGKFQSNFLYLDGHADTKSYDWQGGLLNVVHKPIPQRWDIERGEGDYRQTYADSYKAEYPN